MSPERRQRIREIFEACLGELTAEARTSLVLRECAGDAELEQAVSNLLDARDETGSFLDRPFDQLLHIPGDSQRSFTADQALMARPGSVIGRYKVRELIGEGGFGVVYVAEQERPIRRKVALKLIKPGMDSRDIIARFEAERQALAMMDHPNVAKVLDAGTTDSGHPYFVMELVHGIPITAFCDQQKLSTRERLELFCDVCQAVQHSHQKGIIHRDLKPTNVLVTLNGGKPIAKVIDFGVAKALNQQLTEHSVYTSFGQMIGTPLYMSPEQAELSERDVDTRTDIYSLGVLLYQLLTGTTPFDPKSLRNAGIDDIRRVIRDQQPHRPSAKLSTFKFDRLTTVADQRQVDPKKLHHQLRGDLDWIVMKALEKDRNRRYASASTFAADVQHYLRGEPIEARPPSKWYYLQKLLQRNRVAVTAGVLIVSAIMAGGVMAARQAVRATKAERDAIDERDRALRAEQDIRRLLYAADIRRAADAWQDHDATRIEDALRIHLPDDNHRDIRGFEWHYLWRQKDRLARQWLQSSSPMYFVLPLPNKLVATAGADGRLHLFDEEGQLQRVMDFGQGELNGLAVSPDGKSIASAGDDGSIALRQLDSLELMWSVQVHQAQAFQVAFTPDGSKLISCGFEPDARVMDARTGTLVGVLPTSDAVLETLAVSSDGVVALGARWGGTWLFDEDLQTLLRHQPYNGQMHVSLSNAGHWLAQGLGDGTILVEQVNQSGRAVHRWKLADSPRSLAFSPDDRILAVGDSSGAIHLLSVPNVNVNVEADTEGELIDETARQYRSWQAHEGRLFGLAFSKDGSQLVTVAQDGRVVAWTVNDNELASRVLHANDLLFDGAGHLLTAGKSELQVIQGKDVQSKLVTTPGPWKSLAMARNTGLICATQETGSEVFQYAPDLSSAHAIWTAPAEESCRGCALSPDGHTLVVEMLPPDSKRLDAESSRYLEAIDLTAPRSLYRLPISGTGNCVVFSPDGRYLAYTRSSKIHVVDAASGVPVHTLAGHRTTATGLAFDPNSGYLASTSADRTMKLWNLRSGREEWSVVAHRASSNDVAFSNDGFTLASVGDDRVLRLWRWQIQRLALEIPLRAGQAKKVQFSSDNTKIAVLFRSGELQLLDATPLNASVPRTAAEQTRSVGASQR